MTVADYDLVLSRSLDGWRPDEVGTLLFLRRDDEVLLIRKKRGHGAGKINAPGGKIDPGESPLQAAVRETVEETGVVVTEAMLAGRFRFVELNGPQWLGFVFLASLYEGEPRETEEADPFWCPVTALPFDQMWEDDRHWLPRLLEGERLEGDFLFDDGRLLAHRLGPMAAAEYEGDTGG
ncbi:MAG: 8-oxo-dGTP diphosphatase [Alphaproteobacteria bacterium]|nr:MAG: 8-oxo-dGTP diphosphatase [Alphaproteobacteria bacterium]